MKDANIGSAGEVQHLAKSQRHVRSFYPGPGSPGEDIKAYSHLMKAAHEGTQNALAIPSSGSSCSGWFVVPPSSEEGWIKLVVKRLFCGDGDSSVVCKFEFIECSAREFNSPVQMKRKREQALDDFEEYVAAIKKLKALKKEGEELDLEIRKKIAATEKINAAKRQLVGKISVARSV